MSRTFLDSVRVGTIQPLGADGIPSAFIKDAVEGAVAVGWSGLAGDEQADLTVHGGPDKAVYGYPAAHYAAWRDDFPEHRDVFVAGGVGENLTITGLSETDLCVGDVHRIGSATLQVCQPRQPCSKFALRFDDKTLPKAMVRNGRAGWYYRVLETGKLAAGDPVACIDRPYPGFGFARLVEIVNFRRPTRDEMAAMAAMDGLATDLREEARKALLPAS